MDEINYKNCLKKLREFFLNEFKEVDPEHKYFSPYFYTYFKKQDVLRNERNFEELRYFVKSVIKATDGLHKKWLDLGCGFGLRAILISLSGVSSVVACDIDKDKISNLKKLLSILPPLGNIHVKKVDGCRLDFADNYFDVVFVSSVLSHCWDQILFINEVYRVLKSDGVFFLFDENNSLYVQGRRNRRKFWKMCEEGPIYDKTCGLRIPYVEASALLNNLCNISITKL